MGLFGTTYKVEHKRGLFSDWHTVLKNVSQKEADKYIESKTGLFGDSKENYRIVKEW
ncbi:hypothetical protein [Listeria fleischmannii]|jgi:hypothetical protein|uniref:hypothetical protein n=1 Tax=Listeria fleischmannii TaxID=1069827 RepID=UPI0004B68F83|nr:hypothetical protein [Listeria fleischmannii]